ncbi:hypothetical protein [Desulfonatronovibrio magnus]|uniref:hypothetical protein n=1 Tax=Desulfonatronovibrio magnus TaxID=698827 RepID=UPI0005EB5591|nr:hypothetical protein [Desulfonatronovibrio magnus]
MSHKQSAGGLGPPASLQKRIVRLILGILIIIGFIGFLSNIERITGKSEVIQVLQEKDIYVGGWYWDIIDEVAEATDFMRGALKRGNNTSED